MDYQESPSILIGPYRLGKNILFEENLQTAMRRYPDQNNSFFAEFIVDDDDELTDLLNALDDAVASRWPDTMDGCDGLDYSPVYHNGKSKMYPTDTYIRAKARPFNPPSLYLYDGTILPMDAPRDSSFYSGVQVMTEVSPLSYESEAGKCGIYLTLNAIAIVSDDREANPVLQFKQRRSADKIRDLVLKQTS